MKEQGPLTEEQEAELAELQPKVAQQKQKKKEKNAKYHRAKMDAAVRVAELEALEGLTEEQAAELELRPKAQQWQKQKERFTDWYRAGKAAAVRVVELEELKEQGLLTEAEVGAGGASAEGAAVAEKEGRQSGLATGERAAAAGLRSWRRWRG